MIYLKLSVKVSVFLGMFQRKSGYTKRTRVWLKQIIKATFKIKLIVECLTDTITQILTFISCAECVSIYVGKK